MKAACAVLVLLLAKTAFAGTVPEPDVSALAAAVKDVLGGLAGSPGETQPSSLTDLPVQVGAASYDSNGPILDQIKEDIAAKFSPSPTPVPIPEPTPDAIQVPAYAGSPTDQYLIPASEATYNKSSFIPLVPKDSPAVYQWDNPAKLKLLAAYVAPSKPDDYSTTQYPPMQCSGNAYCFKNCFSKNITTPLCPPGYTYDSYKDQCSKTVGYKCPDYAVGGWNITDVAVPCYVCDSGYVYNVNTGLCEEKCVDGYEAIDFGGVKYCVQICPKNFWVYGSICLSSQCYNPAACANDVCLPGFTFYWTGAASGGSNGFGYPVSDPTYGGKAPTGLANIATTGIQPMSTSLLDLLKSKQGQSSVDTNCNCCYSLNRDSYTRKCVKPSVIYSKSQKVTCPRLCPPGSTLDLDGLCHWPCPAGCSVDAQNCCYQCPPGMTECSYHGRKFCATNQGLCGVQLDSCSVLSIFYDKLDTSVTCPVGSFFSPVVFTGSSPLPQVVASGKH